MISTDCQARIRPSSRRPGRAAHPEVGTAAACSKLRFAGLGAHLVGSRARELGEGAGKGAELLVAWPKPAHVLADRLDASGDVHAQDAGLGRAQPDTHQPDRVWLWGSKSPCGMAPE
jgi:hypothetical protein